jgi:Cu(I)/Ag(I) efflux system membrane protein CusA/SilA
VQQEDDADQGDDDALLDQRMPQGVDGRVNELRGMKALGIGANIMSLGGIAIAVGAMVDAAIVMIENAHKHLERAPPGKPRVEILVEAAVEVGPSLFFSLLVITVSFLPIFTLESQEGRLFGPLAFTKTFAMAAAALLSVTLVPALMVLFVRGPELVGWPGSRHQDAHGEQDGERPGPQHAGDERPVQPDQEPVQRVSVLGDDAPAHEQHHQGRHQRHRQERRRRHGEGLLAVGVLVATAWPAHELGSEFMPELDEGTLLYMPTTPWALGRWRC